MSFLINKDTKFKIVDKGEDNTIDANTLLYNLELLLDKSFTRGIQDSQNKILVALQDGHEELRETTKRSDKAIAVSKEALTRYDKVFDKLIQLLGQVEQVMCLQDQQADELTAQKKHQKDLYAKVADNKSAVDVLTGSVQALEDLVKSLEKRVQALEVKADESGDTQD